MMSLENDRDADGFNKQIGKPLNMAIRYLAHRSRTVYEMQEYLKKKGIRDDLTEKVIEILLEKKYLDDKSFTEFFVRTKAEHKPKSKFAFQYELQKKGIAPAIIDSVLTRYDDKDLALESVKPKIRQWQRLDEEQFKKKMINFLRYKGFNYDICLSTLDHFIGS